MRPAARLPGQLLRSFPLLDLLDEYYESTGDPSAAGDEDIGEASVETAAEDIAKVQVHERVCAPPEGAAEKPCEVQQQLGPGVYILPRGASVVGAAERHAQAQQQQMQQLKRASDDETFIAAFGSDEGVKLLMRHMAAQMLNKLARAVIPYMTPNLARLATLKLLNKRTAAFGGSLDRLNAILAHYPQLKNGVTAILGRSSGADIGSPPAWLLPPSECPTLAFYLRFTIVRALKQMDSSLERPALHVLACLLDLRQLLGEALFVSTEAGADQVEGPAARAEYEKGRSMSALKERRIIRQRLGV